MKNNFLQVGQTSECSKCHPEKGYLDENLVFKEYGIKCNCICHNTCEKQCVHEKPLEVCEDCNIRELPPAIGVSQFWNYGEKYHYTDFWKKKILKDFKKKVEGLKERFKCGACDGARCEHTMCCHAIDEVLKILEL